MLGKLLAEVSDSEFVIHFESFIFFIKEQSFWKIKYYDKFLLGSSHFFALFQGYQLDVCISVFTAFQVYNPQSIPATWITFGAVIQEYGTIKNDYKNFIRACYSQTPGSSVNYLITTLFNQLRLWNTKKITFHFFKIIPGLVWYWKKIRNL